MSQNLPIITYCVLISLISLAGGLLPSVLKLTHRRVQLIISVIAGFMLGVGMFHMMPHASAGGLGADEVSLWMVVGIVVMFFLERFFQYHTHEIPTIEDVKTHDHCHDEGHSHEAEHGHDEHHCHVDHSFCMSWTGATIGLTIHSLIAGVALAASMATENTWVSGFAIFLVIFLHKPFDSMTLITLFKLSNKSVKMQKLINLLFAMAIPVGAGVFYLLAGMGEDAEAMAEQSRIVSIGLAFAAGTFVCISMSDLLPELHFHSHDRMKLSMLFLVGILLAWGIAYVERGTHNHGSHGQEAGVIDEHAGHKH